ncbi:MAG: phosphogluconate dehydrogenase (NAD(+)-dependent, decarboxylating) [Nitrososphaeraceae archaeon]
MENKLQLGIIGLGKMGGNLSLQCLDKGIQIVGMSKSNTSKLENEGVKIVNNIKDLVNSLDKPRIIYLSLPAGKTIDAVLSELLPNLNNGDVVLDGGNSFFLDSIEREKLIWQKYKIYFLDCGTSGGKDGARYGANFMVGGKKEGISIAKNIFEKLSINNHAFIHTGPPGSGHFVKLVHNGIEFGMLQAIGEGTKLLLESDFDLDLADIFKNWSNGSVIRSWLIELMEEGLRKNKDLRDIESHVEDTGEVNWLVQYAITRELPIPVISQSIMQLFRSRSKDDDAYRAIALMRHGFGGHPFGRDSYISKERKTSRIQKM